MPQPLTANDLFPLVARLSRSERERLAQFLSAATARDVAIDASSPPRPEEFSSDEESLAWDAEGWENVT